MFFRTARIGCIAFVIGLTGSALAQVKTADKSPDTPAAGGAQSAVAQLPAPLPPTRLVLAQQQRLDGEFLVRRSGHRTPMEFLAQERAVRIDRLPSDLRSTNPASDGQLGHCAGFKRARHLRALRRPAGKLDRPFHIPFDPAAEIVRFYRSILETTTGSWLAFRRSAPNILYYTHIASYRCAIREFRVGLDKEEPDRVVKLAPLRDARTARISTTRRAASSPSPTR